MSAAEKYDVKRALKSLYSPPATEFSRVVVPPLHYLAIDGHGDPNTSVHYAEALEALYSAAYTLKFASKKTLGRDFVVAPLEGLWRSADPAAFARRDKAAWEWTMLINLPDWVNAEMVEAACSALQAKKPIAAAGLLRLHRLDEGECIQIMHIGSFDDEAPTLARLHEEYMPAHGLTFNGDHHEIYLSDARRTEPSKLKTILRQPVRPLPEI
ncbi:GyrI-like domain-containing protein [Microterricola viridarii]|uniref:GyrI-like small molecule binding domain-containing protein n=1 Tax=Microterricola viridarii TaxID=412690 RepID=A0A0X8E2G7_9MICO|nr:GyrI-like domain-containing protein [Microterricola viridarii]AMB59244.1 hypothetical protein AWU67_10635 [Microterricola viridarii]